MDAKGGVRRDRVILSWFSVASLAAAIDGHVVLLDAYIHKGEEQPAYVPTTHTEVAALAPEALFLGHGHGDHSGLSGEVVAKTGALLVGTPEHCDQVKERAAAFAGRPVPVTCVPTVTRGSAPGAQVVEIRPLGPGVCVTVVKHVHSAAEPPDAEHVEHPGLIPPPLPDPGLVLLHPPGPGLVTGLAGSGGDEGSSLLYQFRVGRFSLIWNDSAGPIRERAPQMPNVFRRLPATDVQFGAVLGFNEPTNGVRDPVDYLEHLQPRVFLPLHHDFVAEYGASDEHETLMRNEIARRQGIRTELRWLNDPVDYLRPALGTFDPRDSRWANDPAGSTRPSGTCATGDDLGLPATRRCASRRSFRIRLRQTRSDPLRSARVYVNGRRVRVLRGRRLRARVNLRGLPRGVVRVTIRGRTRSGRTVTSTRRYRTCVPRARR